MKYYSERYDPEVVKRTVTILKADRHDVVVAYNQAYDDANHATDPLSPRSLAALGQYDAHAATLFSAFQRHWRSYRRLFLWVTDHGCHVDSRTGKGTHGRRIAEDMHVPVFFRIEPGSQN